jgi:hypothetical protein
MPIDPLDRKPSDPFARHAAGKRAEDAKKHAPANAPSVPTVVVAPTAKPPLPAKARAARRPDDRLLLKPGVGLTGDHVAKGPQRLRIGGY